MSKISKTYILFAVLSTVIVSVQSCISTDLSLASEFVPTDRNIPIEVKEIDINLGQRYPDSLQTAMTGTAIVGSINTPEYGTVSIGTAMTITPASDSIRWGGSPKFVSMCLDMPASTCQIMDDSQKHIPQNIYVHRLKTEIDSTMIYYNSIKPSHYEEGICSLGNQIYSAGDSIHIYFPEEFAKPLFSLDSMVLDSTELFLKNFYGIYIDCDDAMPNSGRINTFDLSGSTITFVYNSENTAGHRRDTTIYFYVGDYGSVLKIDQDRVVPECDSCGSTVIYDGLAGIKPFIDAKKLRAHIAKLAKEHGAEVQSVMISKAQFEFPFEYPGYSDAFDTWPSNMYLARRLRDSTGFVYYTPISEIYATNYNLGDMNRSFMVYSPDAALYLQSMLNISEAEVDDTYDLWLMPTVSYTSSSSSSSSSYYDYYSYYMSYYYGYGNTGSSSSTTYYYVDNVNYLNCVMYGPKAERHPKLRVTFTVLK